LGNNRVRITEEPRIRLHGKPAILAFLTFKYRQEQGGRAPGDVLDHTPSDLALGGLWHFTDKLANVIPPQRHLVFQDIENNDGVAGGSYSAVLN
jgi:hypothetical protein